MQHGYGSRRRGVTVGRPGVEGEKGSKDTKTNKGEGEYVNSYDDGKAAQVSFLGKQNKQGKQKESKMKKASQDTDSGKESGYSKELDDQIELAVKDLMKNFGWSREEARKAVSEA